ncbi:hypothetical protein, partial [Escherichia coli]|uniref:hypothetical protein n=1 Tax=Escherichia coli TaxID=562 RepID=UPI001BC87BD5
MNSLALALTAAFCGANQHGHGLSVQCTAQYSAPPCCNAPGRRELAGARANCGILRRKSAWSWPVSPSGFAGQRDGPVHPGMFVSGCAALRGDVAPLLPGIFFRPFY